MALISLSNVLCNVELKWVNYIYKVVEGYRQWLIASHHTKWRIYRQTNED